ncbi:MAG: DoxX family membrane protein [Candidatus Latescibacterota bacterium]|nr:MAG: DoxX family membrane protein [Candidatus Latescibacterota bacterium]
MSVAEIPQSSARHRVGDVVLLLLRFGLGVVFIAAALPKIAAPDLFAADIHNYQMLPAWGVNAMALYLPWLELVVGICLVLGIWRRASAFIMAALMIVFMIALVSAAVRGLDISCGCFEVGAEGEHGSMTWYIVRDVAFLVAALVLVRYDGGPRPLDLLLRRTS